MKLCCLCLFLALGTLLFTLAGCSQGTLTPSVAEPSPFASPISATPTLTLLPRDHTPQPNLGIVQGTLSMHGEPAGGHMMYLAAVIHTEGEGMEIAALDPVKDPRVESDASGYFVFLVVPPGRYALGIMSPVGPVLIRGEDEKEIIVEVQAGQIADLGNVQIVPFTQ